jgi:hypothetical protein
VIYRSKAHIHLLCLKESSISAYDLKININFPIFDVHNIVCITKSSTSTTKQFHPRQFSKILYSNFKRFCLCDRIELDLILPVGMLLKYDDIKISTAFVQQ